VRSCKGVSPPSSYHIQNSSSSNNSNKKDDQDDDDDDMVKNLKNVHIIVKKKVLPKQKSTFPLLI
jgi:ligand-binding sensor protein